MTEVLFMGLGVLINAAAVVIGTLIGVTLKNVLKERVTNVIMQGLGITVLGAGILDLADGTAKLSANGFKWGVLFIVLAERWLFTVRSARDSATTTRFILKA